MNIMNNQEIDTSSTEVENESKKFVNPFDKTDNKQADDNGKHNDNVTKIKRHDATVVLTCAAVVIVFITIAFFTFNNNKADKQATKSAITALKATLDEDADVKIIATSKPDSIFGRDFITDNEKMSINAAMTKVSDKVMQLTNNLENYDLENPEVNNLMERQMNTAASLRSIMHASILQQKEKNFSGWKVKVEYECKSKGSTIHSEYWAILDRTGKHVIFSFEIPIV